MNHDQPAWPTAEDHGKALTEVSFLLDIFARTVGDLMGGATVSVGRIAGRQLARKLPVFVPEGDLEECVVEFARLGRIGLEVSYDKATRELLFGRCPIRDVCRTRGLEPGAPLCGLFHKVLDGVVNELGMRPARSQLVRTGDTCAAALEVR